MKSDLDSLMQARNIDVLLVTGPAMHNSAMVYLTGGGHLTAADVIKKRGEAPVLYFNPMERGEAEQTGLKTIGYSNYPLYQLEKEANGSRTQAMALRYQRMLEDQGVRGGRMAIYGQADAGEAVAIFSALRERMPGLELVSQIDDPLMLKAMLTKDTAEVDHIRHMGQVTTGVVGRVADFLSSLPVRDEVLMKLDGTPLTLGEVKGKINLWLAEAGAENPEDTIFAIGRDAGLPHSSGNPSDLMRLGQTIVFDIYPCEQGGGYFYDFTRTWCLGYAPDEAQQLYEQVLSVYRQVVGALKMGASFYDSQLLTCQLFEAMGHPSVLNTPQTEDGYVHSIGHGVGLNIHEMPFSGKNAGPDDVLAPGAIFTIEPGLYYPERGMGVRLEDTYWVNPNGQMEVLADFPMDLVLPVKK